MPQKTLKDLLSEEEIADIVEMYQNNVSLREIERITKHGRGALTRMLQELNVKTTSGNHYRKYFFDFDFFEKIDNELAAYWLGFLYADGSVEAVTAHGYGQRAFKLTLAEQDRDVLEHFKEDLKSSYPIRTDNSRKSENEQIRLIHELRSEKTVQDLERLGCVPKKSLILTFPSEEQVPKILVNHFIRGYFDGDGSVASYKKKETHFPNYIVSFVGTESFIKTLADYIPHSSIYPDKRKTNSWYVNINGNRQVADFYHQIYNGATRYMARKHDKFQPLIQKYDESQGT